MYACKRPWLFDKQKFLSHVSYVRSIICKMLREREREGAVIAISSLQIFAHLQKHSHYVISHLSIKNTHYSLDSPELSLINCFKAIDLTQVP